MEKILIVTADYFPFHSPNSSCIEAIIKEMKSQYKIDVLTARKNQASKSFECIEGVNVYRADNWFSLSSENIKLRSNSNDGEILKLVKKVRNRFSRSLMWPDIAFGWLENAKSLSKKINNINKYDIVISVSLPFTSHLVGMELKKLNPHIRWITYDLDPFADNITYLGLRYKLYKKRNQLAEFKVMKKADAITMTTDLYKYNLKKEAFVKYQYKMYELPIPLLQKKSSKLPSKNNKLKNDIDINLVYSGLFYRDIRNPEYLFEILNHLNVFSKFKFQFNFYGDSNDCTDIVQKYIDRLGKNFIVHGQVSKNNSLMAIQDSDILINIGNTVSHQVPSKIFEYMATGKPIINIYSSLNDTSKSYLDKYGNALNILNDWTNLEGNSKLFESFCENSHDIVLEFDEVSKKLFENTPLRSREILNEVFENIKDKKI